MLSNDLAAELLDKIAPLIHAAASFRRIFLNGVIRLGVYAGSGGGVSGALLALAVLTILTAEQPTPTPTPTPLPF